MSEKSCKSCAKYRFCDEEENTDIENCENWIKQPYMKLVKQDGLIWKFERID